MKSKTSPRRVLIVTGSRAEFGLLRPVMDAVKKHKRLRLLLAVAGEHLLAPARTWREVAADYRIDAKVPMQRDGDRGRLAHARATARGMENFARAYARLKPDWVVVLGDRIEAFAAASAASIAGIAVCHIHGGDRAEGIADEAMRHAITKLSHLHCAATKKSAARIVAMGEQREHVHNTGSPAIDGLRDVKAMGDREARALGDPATVLLVHPDGSDDEGLLRLASNSRVAAERLNQPMLVLGPNRDPGHEIVAKWSRPKLSHLPRHRFLALLKRMRARHGPRALMMGNSSAGLIEAPALGISTVNIGPRQAGRECPPSVIQVHVPKWGAFIPAFRKFLRRRTVSLSHLYGDGRAGPRIAALLAKVDPRDPALLRKRNAY